MERPLISIVIPVYNVEKYIKKCLDSVINQTYNNLQIILVDDGSTDSSSDICDEYAKKDARIEVIHQKNKGLPGARNTGLKYVNGKYIGFVDSDDWIDKNMFEHLLKNMEENNADISTVEEIESYNEEEIIQDNIEITNFTQEEYAKRFFKIGSQKIVHYVWNKLYKKEIVIENTFEEEFSIGEDVVAFYKMLLRARTIVSSNQKMYYYRQSSGMTSKFNERYFGLKNVWDRVKKITDLNNASRYDEYVDINIARINFTLLTELAIANEYKNSKYKDKINMYLTELKKNKKMLFKADIAKSRKMMIWLACLNYGIYARVVYLLKR